MTVKYCWEFIKVRRFFRPLNVNFFALRLSCALYVQYSIDQYVVQFFLNIFFYFRNHELEKSNLTKASNSMCLLFYGKTSVLQTLEGYENVSLYDV